MIRFRQCRARSSARKAHCGSLPYGSAPYGMPYGSNVMLPFCAIAFLSVFALHWPVHATDAVAPASPETSPETPHSPELGELSLEELMQLEVATVTTASKKEEKTTAAPATVIVISARDIRLRGYSTLKDVLRDLPGMETIEFYHSEDGTLVPVRGIVGNNKIIVLVNGMRVNPPGGEEMPVRSDLSVRQAAQIEVVYGPGSTLYGEDAISAVINIKTRPATDYEHGEIGISGGVHATREAWLAGGSVFGAKKQNSISAYAQYHDSDLSRLHREYPAYWQDFADVATPKGAGLVPQRQDLGVNGFARLDLKNASLQFWHRRSRRSSSEGILPTFGFLQQAKWEDSSTIIEGKHSWKLSGKTQLDSTLSYNEYEIDPQSRFVFPASPTQWFLDDFKYGIGKGITLEETIKSDLRPGLSLLGGVVASTFNVIPKATVPGGANPGGDVVAQAGNFVYFDNAGRHEVPRASQVKYQTYGTYLELAWQINRRLRSIAGARLTKDSRFNDIPFTPRAALIYEMGKGLTAKYMFTRAYIAPAPYFAYGTFANSAVLNIPNPNLEPETAESHEVNLAFVKKNINLGLSVYRGAQSGLIKAPNRGSQGQTIQDIIWLDEARTQQRRLVQAANGGDSRNLGADLYGRANLGRISPWFSYSYVDYKENNGGVVSHLQGISAHNLRVGATFAVNSRLFLTPGLVLRSTPANVDDSRLPGFAHAPWEIDLHAGYAIKKNLELFTTLRNITDHHYALGGSRAVPPSTEVRAIPQEPFRGEIGLRYAF